MHHMKSSVCGSGTSNSLLQQIRPIRRPASLQAQVTRTPRKALHRPCVVRAVAKPSDTSTSDRVRLTLDLGQAAFQEPVAFWGGVFAGFLGLNLDQDPLKEWIQQTLGNIEELNPESTAIVPVRERNFRY